MGSTFLSSKKKAFPKPENKMLDGFLKEFLVLLTIRHWPIGS
ncbi:hypothetical protein [Peribacillus frigoritolerans]